MTSRRVRKTNRALVDNTESIDEAAQAWLDERVKDPAFVAKIRERQAQMKEQMRTIGGHEDRDRCFHYVPVSRGTSARCGLVVDHEGACALVMRDPFIGEAIPVTPSTSSPRTAKQTQKES